MSDNNDWGGEWTNEKLSVLRGYLEAYLIALKNQPFKLGYIDAFAGSGYREAEDDEDMGLLASLFVGEGVSGTSESASGFWEGSARIALSLSPGFDAHVFIEKNAEKVAELRSLADSLGRSDITKIYQGDANEQLQRLCNLNWQGRRAVVFLDPYGMQVEWATLEALASTEAVDVWILVPDAIAVNRLLTRDYDRMQEGWEHRLNLTFGTDDWQEKLYETATERARKEREKQPPSLFGEPEPIDESDRLLKSAGLEEIRSYYIDRLKTIFPFVSNTPRTLRSESGNPLYSLMFAAANPNPRAGAASLRIAGHLLGKAK